MDNQVVYTKVPQYEQEVKIKGQEPPPYVTGDEEALIAEQRGEEKRASVFGLCLGNVMSLLFCFWPAALVGIIFTMKARYASSERAQRYARIARRCMWVSFIVGAVMMVIASGVQLAVMTHMAKRAYKGAVRGYVAGQYEGETKGAADAHNMIANGQTAKFPELVPGQANVFDVSSPFWTQIQSSESVRDAARVVGYSFGFVDGYKKGFCSTENADCTGVNMQMISDFVHCEHMKEKMERMRTKYVKKLEKAQAKAEGGEQEVEVEDEEEEEHHHGHMHGEHHNGHHKQHQQ